MLGAQENGRPQAAESVFRTGSTPVERQRSFAAMNCSARW